MPLLAPITQAARCRGSCLAVLNGGMRMCVTMCFETRGHAAGARSPKRSSSPPATQRRTPRSYGRGRGLDHPASPGRCLPSRTSWEGAKGERFESSRRSQRAQIEAPGRCSCFAVAALSHRRRHVPRHRRSQRRKLCVVAERAVHAGCLKGAPCRSRRFEPQQPQPRPASQASCHARRGRNPPRHGL